MFKNATAVPAYGRDYKSIKALVADWKANKDFQLVNTAEYGSGYFNKDDAHFLKEQGYTHILFHFNKRTKVHVIRIW